MALTAFTRRLGLGQGRLPTAEAISGTFAFVLGEDAPGAFANLVPGDFAEVAQPTDLTGALFVRASLRLRLPARTPPGLAWEAAICIDGLPAAACRARPGRERLVTDLAANVSKLAGLHLVSFRLTLLAV